MEVIFIPAGAVSVRTPPSSTVLQIVCELEIKEMVRRRSVKFFFIRWIFGNKKRRHLSFLVQAQHRIKEIIGTT